MEDIKKYAVKEHIPTVNEGIEEPKMVVRCENCRHKDRVSDYCMYLKREVKREEFCCYGVQK